MNSKEHSISNFRSRVVRAGSWSIGGYAVSQAIRLLSNLILTRLLVPEMFGVMAIVFVITFGLTLFSDIGLLQNIVNSKRGEEQRFLNTAWVVQILRGLLLFLCMLLISWIFSTAGQYGWLPVDSAYSAPILPTVIAILAFNVLIAGFNSTNLLLANRKLLLGKVTIIEIISQVIGVIFMVSWAMIDPTIWSLVYGTIFTTLIKMFLSHVLLPSPFNRFEWDSTAFHEIFHFGKWIFMSSILGFLLSRGDQLILGGLISAELLGVYSIALYLATALRLVFGKVFGSVFYPALSEVAKNRRSDLSATYYKMRKYIDASTYFTAGLLFFIGNIIIAILYDERYIEAGWMLQILSLSLIYVGPGMLADQCFLALGRAKLLSYLIALQVIVLFVTVPILFYYGGLDRALWGIIFTPVVKVIVSYFFMHKYNLLQIKKEFMLVPVFFVGCFIGYLTNLLLI